MRKSELSQKTCDHCGGSLGESRLIVHALTGVSGVFHVSNCYERAAEAWEMLDLKRLHGDFEALERVESR